MIVDKTYWASDLPLPLSPSDDDVLEYKFHLKKGTTLLLGCTKKLILLSDRQLDYDPWYEADTVIVGDWVENKHFYTNIIIDGGLCLTKQLCDSTIDMASKNCKVLIARVFNYKLDTMRIATHFPNFDDFEIKPTYMFSTEKEYTFYIWEF
jgi:hypothetical protein